MSAHQTITRRAEMACALAELRRLADKHHGASR